MTPPYPFTFTSRNYYILRCKRVGDSFRPLNIRRGVLHLRKLGFS